MIPAGRGGGSGQLVGKTDRQSDSAGSLFVENKRTLAYLLTSDKQRAVELSTGGDALGRFVRARAACSLCSLSQLGSSGTTSIAHTHTHEQTNKTWFSTEAAAS